MDTMGSYIQSIFVGSMWVNICKYIPLWERLHIPYQPELFCWYLAVVVVYLLIKKMWRAVFAVLVFRFIISSFPSLSFFLCPDSFRRFLVGFVLPFRFYFGSSTHPAIQQFQGSPYLQQLLAWDLVPNFIFPVTYLPASCFPQYPISP